MCREKEILGEQQKEGIEVYLTWKQKVDSSREVKGLGRGLRVQKLVGRGEQEQNI